MAKYILLDLNYTLAENSNEVMVGQGRYNVKAEKYRQWLVDLLRDNPDVERVILITARTDNYEAATLRQIAAKCDGWQPDEQHFKPLRYRYMKAHDWKQKVMTEHVFPEYGMDAEYLALESNANTRAMYAQLGIPAVKVHPDDKWEVLPNPGKPNDGQAIMQPKLL